MVRKSITNVHLKGTSDQDGGIDRYALLPHTTKRGTTTNLKTKNNQNCQKIELCGSLKTKELKKKHSPRLVEEAETGSWGTEDPQQGGGWWTRWSHICVWVNQEEQLGSETDCATQGSSMVGNKESKPLAIKILRGLL